MRAVARLATFAAFAFSTLLTACGGGGGGDTPPVQTGPTRALVWGEGSWGARDWSSAAAPAHLGDGVAATNVSPTDNLKPTFQELSR